MAVIILTSIISSASFFIGATIGYIIGNKRGREYQADRNYDELVRYYESPDGKPQSDDDYYSYVH